MVFFSEYSIFFKSKSSFSKFLADFSKLFSSFLIVYKFILFQASIGWFSGLGGRFFEFSMVFSLSKIELQGGFNTVYDIFWLFSL